MRLTGPETCPLPEDPLLADVAGALNASGTWAFITDRRWELAYMTDDVRLSIGALGERAPAPIGAHWFGCEAVDVMLGWSGGVFSVESWRVSLRAVAAWLLADTPGGLPAVREAVDPRLHDALDEPLGPASAAAVTYVVPASYSLRGQAIDVKLTALRLRDEAGVLRGTAFVGKPAAGMSVLGTMTAAGDLQHFERVQRLARAARRPTAILFADLEASTPLARRLSTAAYFALGRRIVRAADRRVVDAGGLAGRHVGDGLAAFFLAEHAGSESAAARACIEVTRALRGDLADVAERSGLEPEDVSLRFGLHWGATVHIGQVATAARTEVDALGDEVNEAARIEACATGGRALASKSLLERLDDADAGALGLDPGRLRYVALGDVPGAPEKALRDAPALAVCEV